MTVQKLLHMRDLAEDGQVQFKEQANDRYDVGREMVAFRYFSLLLCRKQQNE